MHFIISVMSKYNDMKCSTNLNLLLREARIMGSCQGGLQDCMLGYPSRCCVHCCDQI